MKTILVQCALTFLNLSYECHEALHVMLNHRINKKSKQTRPGFNPTTKQFRKFLQIFENFELIFQIVFRTKISGNIFQKVSQSMKYSTMVELPLLVPEIQVHI